MINPDTKIVVRSLRVASPAIECGYDRDLAPPHVIEVFKAEKEVHNAVIINCFDDPGLYAVREVSSRYKGDKHNCCINSWIQNSHNIDRHTFKKYIL